ncbi:MAG: MBL fold metallo-hydrolase [Ignavibacteriaceae bacterium]|jgi:L-ascorbate metabolism protein UlaG (beta-lactamase superfamily)|nr:MBL fold metallo-hydrolase [Ignavibacteriaceae bacterium]
MRNLFTLIVILFSVYNLKAQNNFQTDIIKTSAGDLKITFIGHASLIFEFKNMIIHIDPVSKYADYSKLPKADLILITHEHYDHLDSKAIELIKKDGTKLFCNEVSLPTAAGGSVLKNGETVSYKGIKISAVPAYNIVNKRENGEAFHPKGIGNGYVLTFANVKIYIAGDTENISEMKNLKGIDFAFLPMNLPYTMTPAMIADAVKLFNPKILYPYHTGNTDVNELVKLLKNKKDCEVRIRKMN